MSSQEYRRGGKKVLGLGTIFQIAAELGKAFPSQIKRSIPLASGHLLLEAVCSQALCSIINRETVSFFGSQCRAILPHSLHKVEGVLAGIPEEEDLACLGGRLTTSPDLQCQILRLERLEGTPPPTWIFQTGGGIVCYPDPAAQVCEGGGHLLCFESVPQTY